MAHVYRPFVELTFKAAEKWKWSGPSLESSDVTLVRDDGKRGSCDPILFWHESYSGMKISPKKVKSNERRKKSESNNGRYKCLDQNKKKI